MTNEKFEELLQKIGFPDDEIQIIVRKTSINENEDKEYFKTLSSEINRLVLEGKNTDAKDMLDCQCLLFTELQNRYTEQLMKKYRNDSSYSEQKDEAR